MQDHYLMQQLDPVTLDSADEDQRRILELVQKRSGFIPNMYANMANLPALLETYLHGYGLFRKGAEFSPAEQEVIFLAVSKVNRCAYCTAAHRFAAHKMAGIPAPVLDAIRNSSTIPDRRLAALFDFTVEMTIHRGLPPVAVTEAFLHAGYSEKQILGIVLAIANKTLSNYTNHLFNTELDEQFAAYKGGS